MLSASLLREGEQCSLGRNELCVKLDACGSQRKEGGRAVILVPVKEPSDDLSSATALLSAVARVGRQTEPLPRNV